MITDTQRRDLYKKKVRSQEYVDWIYDILKNRDYDGYDDELALYDDKHPIDQYMGKLLSFFSEYLQEQAEKQHIQNLACDRFEYLKNYVKYKDLYFCHILLVGQGALTLISKDLDDDFNEKNCIVLDELYSA